MYDRDWELRVAAFARLEELRRERGGVATTDDLEVGFAFEGERIKFWNRQMGIWRPRQLGSDGAALTIVTAPPRPGREPRYDDQVASDTGLFEYRYQGNNRSTWTNVAVRRAMTERRPLIYFYGLAQGVYEPLFPCYIVGDRPADLTFEVAVDTAGAPVKQIPPELDVYSVRRAYATATVKVRLHQHRFRELVLAAYKQRCTICRLAHRELLDAAHILPDRDERGRPEIPNGLALCGVHHSAFDSYILGVDADYHVHIRKDILEEHDGPMLRYGLQELHGGSLTLPERRKLQPNKDYLAERFDRFRAA